jgi:scyllo-inositol 2-dehydrogenase (NADP+)
LNLPILVLLKVSTILKNYFKKEGLNMKKTYQLAIIGFGGMGKQHEKLLKKQQTIQVRGIYDIDPKVILEANQEKIFCYDSFDHVLKDKALDILLIATPNYLHKEMSILAMKAGKHVICEKPVTLNALELTEILDVQKSTQRVFMVHQNRRWDEDFLTVKKVYDEASLGHLYHLEQRVFGSRGIPTDWRRLKKEGGGMLLDWGVHMLDRLLLMIPEKVVEVYCKLSFALEEDADDGFWLFLTFESGKTALCDVGTINLQNLPKWYVKFQKGTLMIDDWHMNGRIVELKHADSHDAKPIVAGAGLTKTMAPRTDGSTITKPLDIVYGNILEFYESFVETIEGGKPRIKNEEVLQVMRLIDLAFESNRLRQVIHTNL